MIVTRFRGADGVTLVVVVEPGVVGATGLMAGRTNSSLRSENPPATRTPEAAPATKTMIRTARATGSPLTPSKVSDQANAASAAASVGAKAAPATLAPFSLK